MNLRLAPMALEASMAVKTNKTIEKASGRGNPTNVLGWYGGGFVMHSRKFLPPIEDTLFCAARRISLRRATEALDDLDRGASRGHVGQLLRPGGVLVGEHQNLSIQGKSKLREWPRADVPRKVPNKSLDFRKRTATTKKKNLKSAGEGLRDLSIVPPDPCSKRYET